MAHFQRQKEPFSTRDYTQFRSHVRDDFRKQCAYCLIHEFLGHGAASYELDHFRPKSKFPDLLCVFTNLFYACHRCNNVKRDKWPPPDVEAEGRRFVDLCSEEFLDHFEAKADGRWIPRSLAGEYTEDKLRLNHPDLVEIRAWLAEYSLYLHDNPVDADTLRRHMQPTQPPTPPVN